MAFTSMVIAGFVTSLFSIPLYTLLTNPIIDITLRLPSLIIVVITGLLLKKHNVSLDLRAIKVSWILLIFLTILGFGFAFSFLLQDGTTFYIHNFAVTHIFTIIGGVSLTCLIIVFFVHNKKLHEAQRRQNILEEVTEQQLLHYQDLLKYEDNFQKFKHDIHAHMNALTRLHNQNKYEEASLYLSNIMETMNSIDDSIISIDTGHDIVDAMLYGLMLQYQSACINVEYIGRIPPNQHLTLNEITSLFSNLLTNAFEAASYHTTDKRITIKVEVMIQRLQIEVANTYSGQVDKHNSNIVTRKKDKKNHGYGLRIIKDIASKHDGVVDIKHDEETFTISVVFLLRKW